MSYFPGKLNINFQEFYIFASTTKHYIATLGEKEDLLLTLYYSNFTAEFKNNNKNVLTGVIAISLLN